jgi:hypothetical protein
MLDQYTELLQEGLTPNVSQEGSLFTAAQARVISCSTSAGLEASRDVPFLSPTLMLLRIMKV